MTTQLFKDPNILDLLEWPLIIKQVKPFTHFNYTAEKRIFTLKSSEQINQVFNLTDLFIERIYNDAHRDLERQIKTLNIQETIENVLNRSSKEAIIDLVDLNQVAILIEIYLENFFVLNDFKILTEDKNDFHVYKRNYMTNFLKEFRSFVTSEGDIDYLKHPLLRGIFQEIIQLEDNIRKKLGSLKFNDIGSALQFEGHDIINDRFVIAIRTDSYRSQFGMIISRSESGQTLYVEPIEVRDQNYKRLELNIRLKKEIYNLSQKFSSFVKDYNVHLRMIMDSVFLFDHINAIAQHALQMGLTRPRITDEIKIELQGMFHPLIPSPVKNDLSLGPMNSGLVISGPNTGGKTAALKTILLTVLLAKNGIFVPAIEACIHLYENLFYFGNDGQNLAGGLSSFAAEVQNYTELFDNLGASNLIVIDEIFNSTSSEEASALAISLFSELEKIGSGHLIVSTHHQMLKSYIQQDKKFITAHVGFDIENNRPTYKLSFGLPGSSQALRIFSALTQKNQINHSIYTNALNILDKKMVSYEKLLEEVAHKEHELSQLLKENKEINQQLKNQKNAMDGVYKLKLQERLAQAEARLKKLFDQAEANLTAAKKLEISRKALSNNESQIRSNLNAIKNEIQPEKQESLDKYSHLKPPVQFMVDEEYFSTFLGQTVRLKSFNQKKNEAMVSKGILTIKCPLDSLRILGHKAQNQHNKINISFEQTRDGQFEYDCRGMRLDEFKVIVEQGVSDLLTNKIPFLNIIHGHGTGTLKSWIRTYIKTHSEVKMDQSESGNDGETRIIIS